jgi:hypothetical protein
MKFTTFALIATAQAIQVQNCLSGKEHQKIMEEDCRKGFCTGLKIPNYCVSKKRSDQQFHALDVNHSGTLSKVEIVAGLNSMIGKWNFNPTGEDWTWIYHEAAMDSGAKS